MLQVSFQPEWFSDLDLDLGDERPGPGEWALRIAEALRASVYVNPPGGRDLFDPEAFAAAGVRLVIRSFDDLRYEPRGYTAEPGLSVIDVLMWNDLATVREHLAARAP